MMGKKTKDRQLGLREIKNLLNHRGDSEIKKKKNTLQTKSGVLRKPKTMEEELRKLKHTVPQLEASF